MIYVKSKENKIKIYTGLLITVICIIGISYAWFRLYLRQSENNKIASRNCFSTSLTEDSAKIDLVDAVSMYDEEGLEEKPFTFTIKNNCSGYVKAYITIDSQYRDSSSSSYLKDDFVKVNLSPKGTTNSPSVILTDKNLIDLDNNRKGYLIVDAGLNSNEERSFDLRIWIDSETTTSDGLNKTWLGKIVVVTQASNFASPDGWNGAKDGTLLAAIKRDNTVTSTLTTPGSEASLASETVLASAADDYGTSYYFRGAVKNNYVEFANKCWRIVRVGGDGSVKLILHNDNTTSAANPCSSANNSSDAAFARYSGTTYKSAFNENYDDNAYVGFKYGTPGSSKYEATHANTNKSTILNNLEIWYNDNLKTYESVIDDTVWCNDKTNVTDTSYNPFNMSNVNGLGYAKNVTYYGAIQRLLSTSGSAGGTGPSLKCNGKLSKITLKVGLITADELAFAGYAYGFQNSTTYLQENANDYWWSLSPIHFGGVYAEVWFVGSGRGRFDYDIVYLTRGVRPSISLRSTTNVTGNGSSESPYIINT